MMFRVIIGLICYFFMVVEAKEPLKIYYDLQPEILFQQYWRKFILETFDCEEIVDSNFTDVDNASVVFIIERKLKKVAKSNLIEQMKKKSFLIIHLSDEAYEADWELYYNSFCTFREYYSDRPDPEKKIHFLPLTCKHDFSVDMFYEELPNIDNRNYLWSFVGQVSKSNRRIMLLNFLKLNLRHFTHFNSNFDSKDCLCTQSYQKILKQTLFVPSPKGWINDDCFRLYEALECGCIPIVEKGPQNYFRSYYGDVPFIVVDDWSKVKPMMNELLSDTSKLESIRKQCFDWWVRLKMEKKVELENKIHELLKKNEQIKELGNKLK